MPDKFRTLIMIGLPGTGKGTHGRVLGCIPGFFYCSTGELFRSVDPESRVGQKIRSFIDRGELVPDELAIDLWQEYMERQIENGRFRPQRETLVLDGMPRTTEQARRLDALIDVVRVIHLTSHNDQILIDRLLKRATKEGRSDDASESVIRHRLEVHRRETNPILSHYPTSRILDVDASGTILDVLAVIVNALSRFDELD